MWKLTSWGFRKCGSFWDLEFLKHSYRHLKSGQISRKNFSKNGRHKKKTRPQYWFFSPAIESACVQHGWVHADSMAKLKIHYCGRVFFLWRLLFLVTDSKFQSLPTLSSHNSCSKPPNLENCYIFGKLSTSAFRWAIRKPAGVNIVRTAGRYFH